MEADSPGLYALKIWLLTGTLSVTLLLVGYFLKRILDNIDQRTKTMDDRIEKAIGQLSEHNARLLQVLTQVAYHGERINSMEDRIDNVARGRQ